MKAIAPKTYYIVAYSNVVMQHPWIFSDIDHAREWLSKSVVNRPVGIWRIKPKTIGCDLMLHKAAKGGWL